MITSDLVLLKIYSFKTYAYQILNVHFLMITLRQIHHRSKSSSCQRTSTKISNTKTTKLNINSCNKVTVKFEKEACRGVSARKQ